MDTPARSTMRKVLRIVFSLILIVLAVWVFQHRQMLQDQIALARYEPPAAIVELAQSADLSDHGTDLFFVNEPELHGKQTFSEKCSGVGDEQSNVLGCFTGTRIYIYDVPDSQLEGIEEVTAAHEMLHAAYMRLDNAQRDRIDNLVRRQLDTNMEPHVEELIAVYERLEPGQLLNEMHSILATEQSDLLPELNDYFSQYFNDRQAVVAYADQYRSVFDSLKQQQQALADELDALADEVNATTDELNRRISTYNQAVASFNQRAGDGGMTESQFESERATLEAERLAIDAATARNDDRRRLYDQRRQEFDALAVEFSDLQSTISSKPVEPEGVQ